MAEKNIVANALGKQEQAKEVKEEKEKDIREERGMNDLISRQAAIDARCNR